MWDRTKAHTFTYFTQTTSLTTSLSNYTRTQTIRDLSQSNKPGKLKHCIYLGQRQVHRKWPWLTRKRRRMSVNYNRTLLGRCRDEHAIMYVLSRHSASKSVIPSLVNSSGRRCSSRDTTTLNKYGVCFCYSSRAVYMYIKRLVIQFLRCSYMYLLLKQFPNWSYK